MNTRRQVVTALLGLGLPGAGFSSPASGAARYLAELTLVDQDGHQVDLYADLVAQRTVVIHSFFAGCASSCPMTMATLKLAQARFEGRMGHEVRFASITVDPVHDTPAVLKAYASRMGAHAGWSFLTGTEAQVRAALQRMGQYVNDPATHTDLLVVGNARTGLWKKLHSTMAPAQVVDLIAGVANDPGA